MNNVNLSKSKYCSCVQCKKILWLNKYKPEVITPTEKDVVFKNGRVVGELAKGIFGKYEDVEFDRDLNNMIKNTQELLKKKPNVITEASFNYDNNFCSVDILKNDIDGVEIYEVKSSSHIRDIYSDDIAYQYYILSKLGYNVKKAALVHINGEYVRKEELELDKLFNIEDYTEIAISKEKEIEQNIIEINKFMDEYKEDNEPNIDIGINCTDPYLCDFWSYCTRNLPKPNIFDVSILGNNAKKIKFGKYYEGKVSFEDLQNEDLQERATEQISFELYNLDPKINKEAIKEILDSLKYPLYFIDYETYQIAIPEIIGAKPYQQLPFQYSLHIIKKEGAPIEHREFLADIEDKNFVRHFAESMIKDLQEDGSIIIYSKFETTRNNEVSRMYPDLKDKLERINNRTVDFLVLLKVGIII